MIRALILLLLQAGVTDNMIREIAESGRVVNLAQSPSERISAGLQLAPGQPPLLQFRYFEGKERGRHTDLDLVLDDAGH